MFSCSVDATKTFTKKGHQSNPLEPPVLLHFWVTLIEMQHKQAKQGVSDKLTPLSHSGGLIGKVSQTGSSGGQRSHSPVCLFVWLRRRGHQEPCKGRWGYRWMRLTGAGLATATEVPTHPFSNWVSAGNLDALWRYNESSNRDLDFYQHPRHPSHLHHLQPQSAGSALMLPICDLISTSLIFLLFILRLIFFSNTDRLINRRGLFFFQERLINGAIIPLFVVFVRDFCSHTFLFKYFSYLFM